MAGAVDTEARMDALSRLQQADCGHRRDRLGDLQRSFPQRDQDAAVLRLEIQAPESHVAHDATLLRGIGHAVFRRQRFVPDAGRYQPSPVLAAELLAEPHPIGGSDRLGAHFIGSQGALIRAADLQCADLIVETIFTEVMHLVPGRKCRNLAAVILILVAPAPDFLLVIDRAGR